MAIPAYYSLLQRGSSGPDVALVQTWLNGVRDACTWYGELKADGKFGISTENAVKEAARCVWCSRSSIRWVNG